MRLSATAIGALRHSTVTHRHAYATPKGTSRAALARRLLVQVLMSIRSAFVQALEARGLSSEGLARLVGCSASYAFQLRRGTVPGPLLRARIALVLGVDERDLWPAEVGVPLSSPPEVKALP